MKKILAVILTGIIAVSSITMVSATSSTRLIGDANNDGAVSIEDATTIQKYLASIIDLEEKSYICADTDGNGAVSIEDATTVQKYLAGIISDFPANQPDPTEPTTKPTEPTTKPTEKPTEAPTEKPTIAPTHPTTKPTEPTTKPGTVTPNEMELEILRLVNVERAKLGIKELKFGDFYYEAAKVRAKEIDTHFAHIRPDGRACFTAIEDLGIPVLNDRYSGENCARYFNDAETVVKGFMNSEGHRQNIIYPEFDYLAVAVYESEKYPGYYTVEQLFLSDVVD